MMESINELSYATPDNITHTPPDVGMKHDDNL